ncbi:B-cell linker protein-like isoform X3 [Mytilus edulis]|uniref:B-cell linker protein-like isoform X3 n=1 Tax=Mytilus edulis TaxID=6550 RepID=UPI0039EEFEE9
MARRQLPLPDGIAPSRRAPPPLPADDDIPPPPVPNRPLPGRPTPSVPSGPPAVPTSSRPSQPKPQPQKNKPILQPAPDSGSEEEYSFDSDSGSSTKSYEDMSGQSIEPPIPDIPKRGYKDNRTRPPPPPPANVKPPPEPEIDELYDDGDVGDGDIYDEAAMGGAGSEEEGETYDDAEIGDAADQQEEYADCQVEEEIEPPQESYDEFQGVADDTYEVEEAQEEEIGLMYQECDVGAPVSEELYQIADDETPPPPAPAPPIAAAPALPPPRPKQKRDDAPPPPRNVEKKQPVPKPTGMGMPAIGMGDILNIKDRLKKVQPQKEPEKKEPKQYTDHNELQAKFNFFKNKEREDSSSDSDEAKKPLKPSLNKPLPVKPSDVPSGRFPKPVAKKRPNVPLKPSRVSDEQNDSSPNFLSQVKLKHVNRPVDTVEKEVTSNIPLQPPKREPSPLKFGRSSDSSDKNALQNHTGPSFMGQKGETSVSSQPPGRNFPPTRPVPNARPTEKKSFLHAYLDKNPEVSNQRIPPKLVPKLKSSDSLPPVPPPVKEIPSQHRDLPPPPSNATPGLPPPRGKDGYTKVSVTEAEENNNEDDDQEIYDDAISFEDPLLKERWYFGEIDRMVGNDKLKKVGTNGSFLLRKSTKGGNNQPYTLMVLYNDHIYNLKIRERNDGRMAIGEEKPDEMSFMSVENLIKHHQSNDVILVHKDGKQDTTMLIRSPMK